MMSKNEKLFTLVINCLAFCLMFAVVVPFGTTSVTNGELVFKCLIAPIMACVLFVINSYFKYINRKAIYKYNSFSAYLPIFVYLVSILAYGAIILLRVGPGVVFSTKVWIVVTFLMVLGASILTVLGILIHRFIVIINTKENLFLDIAIFILLIVLAAVMKNVITKYVGVVAENAAVAFLQFKLVPLLLTLAVFAVLMFVMLSLLQHNEKFVYASRQELIDKWREGREEVYNEAKDDILFSLYLYTKDQLDIYDELDFQEDEDEEEFEESEAAEPQVEEVKAAEVEEAKEAVLEKSNEELEALEKRLEELQKEKEELTPEVVEEKAPEVKEEYVKDFKPSMNEMVNYAMSFDNVTFTANAEGTNYRFNVGKKVFFMVNETPKDYRMTFLMDLPEAAILSQNVSFAKAKSPKGIYYFKLNNKGEFDEITVYNIIKNAYGMVETIAERDRIAKEEEKARKAEERLAAKLAAMSKEERQVYLARQEKRRLALEKKAADEAKGSEE